MADVAAVRGVYEKVKGSGDWWIRWADSEGKMHREKGGNRTNAKNLVEKRRLNTLQKKKLPEQFRTKVTFDSLCDDANEHSRATNDPKVTHDLSLKIERLRPVFGDRDAASISKQEIVRWLTDQTEQRKWAASTRNRWQAAFSLIYRVGMENERTDRNPAAGIRRKTENNTRVRFLSNEEETALRDVMLKRSGKFIPQLDLSLHTGMRRSEQFRLQWECVDLERKLLTLPKTKNGNMRHIPLNSVAMGAFNTLKGLNTKPTGAVFPSVRAKGEALQGPRGWFDCAVAEAKIEGYTWHCNRHSFASRLVMAGVDIRTVGELLGHKSLTMTMRYAHLSPAHNAAAVDRLVPVPKVQTGTTTGTAL